MLSRQHLRRRSGVESTGGYPGARHWALDRFQAGHDASIFNQELVDASETCGCFYCLATFAPSAVTDWCDGKWIGGLTALCPRCGIDSVLPSAAGLPLDADFLEAMQMYWFAATLRREQVS